jgi:hypothetical protein
MSAQAVIPIFPLRVILGATTVANDAGLNVKFGGDFE